MGKLSRMAKVTAFFFGSLVALAAIVFIYIYFSGASETGIFYLSPYLLIVAFALLVSASLARGQWKKER